MKEYNFNGFHINHPKKNKRNKIKETRQINKKKVVKTVIIILIIAIITTIFTLYDKNEKVRSLFDEYIFRKNISGEKLQSIQVENIKDSKIYAYNGKILVLNKNVLKFYNKFGVEETSINIEITTPIFESNGEYLCIAEKDGQRIYVLSGKNILWQKDIEGNISNISINSNGYISVCIEGTSYSTIVQTYDNIGTELFKTYLSTSYVMDTDISTDNKLLAIAEIDFSGILVQSNIKIISIEKARDNSSEPIIYNHIAEAGDLVVDIKYQNKDTLVCGYDNHIDVIKDNTVTKLADSTNNEVLFVDINNNIIDVTKVNGQLELQIMNVANQNIKIYKIEGEPKTVNVYGNIVVLNLGTELLIINNNGWLEKRYISNQEINNLVVCDDLVGIIGKDKIEIIPL